MQTQSKDVDAAETHLTRPPAHPRILSMTELAVTFFSSGACAPHAIPEPAKSLAQELVHMHQGGLS